MVEMPKMRKKGTISEEDVSALLQRYTPTAVLALLQEVAQLPDVRIDWNALVNKTSTGISNAREYQMLWRHLAYGHALLEKLEDGAQPLDDDSDLEYDLEAFPSISTEASAEATACVKVLIASSLPSDSSLPNSSMVEAPLTINIPCGQSSRAPSEYSRLSGSMQGTNITIPVSVQKSEGFDANGSTSGSLPARKKRKPWSSDEDKELIAAVQKCGEGNWANILKGDFKGDRSASQLSQRWTIIRKKHKNLNVGGANSNGSQLSEAQLAARHAMSLALDMPVKNLTTSSSIAGTNPNATSSNSAFPATPAEALPAGTNISQAQQLSQQGPVSTLSQMGSLGSAPKSRATSKKTSAKSTFSSQSMLKATAVAAGARIATPSAAASLLKDAQSRNAVHIMPGVSTLIKSSVAGGANPLPANHLGAHPNVHYKCAGPPTTSLSTYSAVAPSVSRTGSAKPAAPGGQLAPSPSATSVNISSEQTNAATTSLAVEYPAKQETKTSEETKVPISGNVPKAKVLEDQACVSSNTASEQVQEDQATLSNTEVVLENKKAMVSDTKCLLKTETAENDQATIISGEVAESQNVNDNKIMDFPVAGECENQSAANENSGNQNANEKQTDLPNTATDCGEKSDEVLYKATAGEI